MIEEFLAATVDMTQAEAAALVGVKQPTYSRWKNGDRRPLRLGTRRAMEDVLRRAAQQRTRALCLPDTSALGDEAGAFFRERIGSYVMRGWDRERIERAADAMVAAVIGLSALRSDRGATDAEQVRVLSVVAEHQEEAPRRAIVAPRDAFRPVPEPAAGTGRRRRRA